MADYNSLVPKHRLISDLKPPDGGFKSEINLAACLHSRRLHLFYEINGWLAPAVDLVKCEKKNTENTAFGQLVEPVPECEWWSWYVKKRKTKAKRKKDCWLEDWAKWAR